MLSRAGLICTGAVGLLLASTWSGRAEASPPETASPGASAPKKEAPAADAKGTPAVKKDAPDAKGTPAVKKDPADAKTPPAAVAKTPGKNEPPTKGNATPASGKTVKAAEEPTAADVDEPVDTAKAGKAKAKTETKTETKTATHKKSVAPKPRAGEGPSPAMPPPLTIGGLRDEVRREGGPVPIDATAPPRTKVEQMLAEITKTREAMREATTRLELLMGDGADAATAGASAPGAPAGAAGAGKPAAKNPLDVLAKALRGIKPEQAAPIVARLDRRLAATVLLRMPPVDAGKIMGALKPDTAAELATQIAMRVTPGEAKR